MRLEKFSGQCLGCSSMPIRGWLWNGITELLKDLGRADLTASYGFGKLVFCEGLSPADWRYLGRLVIPAPAPKS